MNRLLLAAVSVLALSPAFAADDQNSVHANVLADALYFQGTYSHDLINAIWFAIERDGHLRLKAGATPHDAAREMATFPELTSWCVYGPPKDGGRSYTTVVSSPVSGARIAVPFNGSPEYAGFSPTPDDAAFWTTFADLTRCR